MIAEDTAHPLGTPAGWQTTLRPLSRSATHLVSKCCSARSWRLCWRIVILASLVFLPAVALAAASDHMMEVKIMDKVVGKMNVTGYDASKTPGGSATASINGNFVKQNNAGMAISAEAEQLLKDKFPLGLTYLQTHIFMFDSGKQQKMFRDKDGNDLKGMFPDPPQGGYKYPFDPPVFTTDMTPWYSTLEPSNTPGTVPPSSFGANQFSDTPIAPFGDFPGPPPATNVATDGLAKLLMGMNGMWKFEAALVGVKEVPGNLKTGKYKVAPLKTFMWGLNFTYMSDGVEGFTAADYKVEKKDFMFGVDISSEFRGAFDRMGDNSGVEWDIDLVRLPIVDDKCNVTWGSNNTDRKIFDRIPAGGKLEFEWTKDGNPHPLYHKYSQSSATEKTLGFVRPKDRTVTDWKQKITNSAGTSSVVAGNLVMNSPFAFAPLEDLPQIDYLVPDFAPIGFDQELTIFTAVDLNVYLNANPFGLDSMNLLGEYVVGATLDDLGLTIINGLLQSTVPSNPFTVQGIYFASSAFVLDPLSPTGWVPSVPGTLLNSDAFIAANGLNGIGINGLHAERVPEPNTIALGLLAWGSSLVVRRVPLGSFGRRC